MTLAKKMGINRDTLGRHINAGGENMTVHMIKQLKEILDLTNEEVIDIFFCEDQGKEDLYII